MILHRIKKGLDLPMGPRPSASQPTQVFVGRVGVLADEYPGLRPRVLVEEGELVRRGQPLFEDRSNPAARFASPASGRVAAVHRGPRRALRSVELELTDVAADADHVSLGAFSGEPVERMAPEAIRALLQESGAWTSLRTRPFSRVPGADESPHAIFVTAIDTEPLAPEPAEVLHGHEVHFRAGLTALSRLTEGPTYLCASRAVGEWVSERDVAPAGVDVVCFEGPHPAGLAGLHMHRLSPVARDRTAWSIGYQDVLAIGELFATGALGTSRVISIAGPSVVEPRCVRVPVGAHLPSILREGEQGEGQRVISGSVLSGKAVTDAAFAFLGRFHRQVSIVPERTDRPLLGWARPGRHQFSVLPVFTSRFFRGLPRFDTSLNGSRRALVPIGVYERVMPMDILPTMLMRALLVGDLERAEALGCLELDEEDLSLCAFVCPGKHDFGLALRRTLFELSKEDA